MTKIVWMIFQTRYLCMRQCLSWLLTPPSQLLEQEDQLDHSPHHWNTSCWEKIHTVQWPLKESSRYLQEGEIWGVGVKELSECCWTLTSVSKSEREHCDEGIVLSVVCGLTVTAKGSWCVSSLMLTNYNLNRSMWLVELGDCMLPGWKLSVWRWRLKHVNCSQTQICHLLSSGCETPPSIINDSSMFCE